MIRQMPSIAPGHAVTPYSMRSSAFSQKSSGLALLGQQRQLISLAELQHLGAWKFKLRAKRYAHIAPENLRAAAARLATFSSTVPTSETPQSPQTVDGLAP
ncbi:MAG: hypothetical protein IT518_23080, partial [Burkholderiales bacterium]|nr:hypothetical protein [Burkholderiales bacterium]